MEIMDLERVGPFRLGEELGRGLVDLDREAIFTYLRAALQDRPEPAARDLVEGIKDSPAPEEA